MNPFHCTLTDPIEMTVIDRALCLPVRSIWHGTAVGSTGRPVRYLYTVRLCDFTVMKKVHSSKQ
jgi:hypothetical protein